jgi:thiol:disulfide interchange protein
MTVNRSGSSQKILALLLIAMLPMVAHGQDAPPGLVADPGQQSSSDAPPGSGDDTSTTPEEDFAAEFGNEFGSGEFGGFGGLGLPMAGPKVSYAASFKIDENGTTGKLTVTADVAPGLHTYSITQPPGGPLPTTIEVRDASIELSGPFTADVKFHVTEEAAYPGVPIQEYDGLVNWTAPFKTKQPLNEKSTIAVSVDGLVCGNGTCEPAASKLEAEFSGRIATPGKATKLRAEDTHAEWTATLDRTQVAPGDVATLSITVTPDEHYHVYKFVAGDDELNFRTLMVATEKSGLSFGEPTTMAKLDFISLGEEKIEFYKGPVTWKVPIRVPKSAQPGDYPVALDVGFATCDDKSCDPPAGINIAGTVLVADKSVKKANPFGLKEVSFKSVADQPKLTNWIDKEDPDAAGAGAARATTPLSMLQLLAALGGGFILNFMPCVLPVIGLKVLSFVDQAGNDHKRVIALNLSFSAGIIAVMLVLASLAIIALNAGSAFGWGQQFTNLWFKVALAGLIFAMALSFLGVWEIPIPGFAMSSTSNEMMEKEGLTGAFLKGILTTVLATPCSGPLLGSLFGLSLSLSSANIMLLYFVVGLGMSLPYLLLCVYPGFVDMLPKPGNWMETLKQLLAFPLLFTVIYFVASISNDYRVATLLLLIAVWFGCWMIGKVPGYANADRKLVAWASAGIAIALGAVVSFNYFGPVNHQLPWVPYNEPQLAQLRREGKTVMVDFTANWCVNCQINMRFAIDKPNVADVVEENQVITMVADWTDRNDAIRTKLNELGANAIPLLVVYPPDPTAEPIILRDMLTEKQVIEALEDAGPSLPETRLTSTTVH